MRVLVAISALAAFALLGCNKPKARDTVPVVRVGTTRPTTLPTTSPVATTTQPVLPTATTSTLIIDNEPVQFPPTKISIAGPILQVSTKDPITALKPDYQGNRYYFQFRLEKPLTIQDPVGFTQVRPKSNVRRDEPDGIFLNGDKKQLQARDAQFRFVLQGNELMVDISGSFLVFERGEMGPSRSAMASGTLRGAIEKP